MNEPLPRFSGVVLAGGASRRFGSDKAFARIAGEPLVRRVAQALAAAGAAEVFVVGGDPAIAALGLRQVPDRHPGEGPLGGVLTALGAARESVVAVLATDLVDPRAEVIAAVVRTLGDHDVALPVSDGRRHSHHAVWRRRAAEPLEAAFAAGERAIKRAVRGLDVVEVAGLPAAALRDADVPDELADDR